MKFTKQELNELLKALQLKLEIEYDEGMMSEKKVKSLEALRDKIKNAKKHE